MPVAVTRLAKLDCCNKKLLFAMNKWTNGTGIAQCFCRRTGLDCDKHVLLNPYTTAIGVLVWCYGLAANVLN
jgi:hypothetical protein